MNKSELWLYSGHVFHRREKPKLHQFLQKVFFIRFPLDRLHDLPRTFFSVNHWNILSFYTKDHGDRRGGDLHLWALAQLQAHGIHRLPTQIELQTFPRVLGFVFNPVSFWFCYENENLLATLVEVNNTFGETHTYVLPPLETNTVKIFQVSPFFRKTGNYEFNFRQNGPQVFVGINYFVDQQKMLTTSISGVPQSWNDSNLIKAWLKNPLMTFYVIFMIHWHALLLFLKKVPFIGTKG